MANYYLLALGFLLSIISGTLSQTPKTSADLTDADLRVFQHHFANILQIGEFTCKNYVKKCGDSDKPSEIVCQVFMQQLSCDDHSDLYVIRKVIETFEAFDPEFVARNFDNMKATYEQNNK